MYDVFCDGVRIARAENAEQETVYILHHKGMKDKDIAFLLGIPLKSVTTLTDSGRYR